MGIQKVHAVVAVTGASIEHKEDAPRNATCIQIQNQEETASSSVGFSLIEESLDRLIWAYTRLSRKEGAIVVDVNQELEAIMKVLDMCSKVEEKLAEDVRAYQALLASALRNSCVSTSPRIWAASSKALASVASHQVGSVKDLRLDNNFSPDTSSLKDLVQQSHWFLESLSKCLTITVWSSEKTWSLRRPFEKVMKKKSSKESCGIGELKRVDALVKMMSAAEKEEAKMAMAYDLKNACQDLNDGISKLNNKINLLHACLVKTRVALLDLLTYSS